MNSVLKLVATLTAAFAVTQTVWSAPRLSPEAGLIGKRYAGGDFQYDHFAGSSLDHAFGAMAMANVPLSRAFDAMVSYSYLDTSGTDFAAIDKTLNASILTHQATEYGTGYFGVTLGHAWNRVSSPLASMNDNGVTWGARAGYEVAIGRRSAINAGVAYADAFDSANTRAATWRYYVEANRWFSSDFAGVVSVSYRQLKSSPDAIAFTAGVRWGF